MASKIVGAYLFQRAAVFWAAYPTRDIDKDVGAAAGLRPHDHRQ